MSLNKNNFNRAYRIIKDDLKSNVVFLKKDNSNYTINIDEKLYKLKNKKIKALDLIQKLNGIKHDLKAVNYTVNILK